jgi:hypothetical protein
MEYSTLYATRMATRSEVGSILEGPQLQAVG